MTKPEALKIQKWFQSNVGLSDWTIDLSVDKPQKDLMGDIPPINWENFLGRSQAFVSTHKAVVWINSSAHKEDPKKYNIEETVIHELLHMFFADTGLEETAESCEYAINRLAAVLVKQMRTVSGQE